ncbi:MAG: response regulator [Bacteroidetes bacterium]|nr:MAG: response regulator [Bacteroidota bacterium]
MANRPLTILLVEDEPAHAEMIKRVLAGPRGELEIVHLSDGESALDYLFQRGSYQGATRPHMVLLDLHLPRVQGLDVLRQIRESETLRMLPVVVLTTSEAEQDVVRAYEHHANSYIVKPLDFRKFTDLMTDLRYYWTEWNCYPWN